MDHDSMTVQELEAAIDNLKIDLEDIEEMVSFDYTFTAAHIGGHRVKKDEERIGKLKEKILLMREMLRKRRHFE